MSPEDTHSVASSPAHSFDILDSSESLRMAARGEELLERAQALARDISDRVHHIIAGNRTEDVPVDSWSAGG